MATRFYFSSTATPSVTPAFSAWDRTAEGVRLVMSPVKDSSALTGFTCWNGVANPAANQNALAVQFVSLPMAAGVAFSTLDTVKGVVRCLESAANDNIDRVFTTLKVYDSAGTTLRATLLTLNNYRVANEWATSATNRQIADGDVLTASYTTVAGDILVLELGGKISAGAGGTSVLGTMSVGSASASDLVEDETGTAADNPWFEISRTVNFLTTATASLTAGAVTLAATATFVPGIAFVAASNSGYATSDTASWSHNCGASPNRYLVVGVSLPDGAQVIDVTYDSISLTRLGVAEISGRTIVRTELWGITAPTAGSHLVEVTLTASVARVCGATSFVNVHQALSVEPAVTGARVNSGQTSMSVTVVTAADNAMVVDCFTTDDTAVTVGSGQVERQNVTGTLGSAVMSTEGPESPAGSVVMLWTSVSTTAACAQVAIALRPTTVLTYVATATLAVGNAELTGSATHVRPTYTTAAGLTAGAVTGTGTGTFVGVETYTGTSTLTVGNTLTSASATHTPPTYASTATLGVGPATLAGTATHVRPTYTAAAALSSAATILAGSVTHITPTYTASASFITGVVSASGSATFTPGTKTATAALIAGHAVLSGEAAHVRPTYTGLASVFISPANLSGSVTFTPGTKTATATTITGVTVFSGSASHATAVYLASASLQVGLTTLDGSVSFFPGIKTASATLITTSAVLAGSASHTPPTYTASASLITGQGILSGSASFTPPVFVAVSDLTTGHATFVGSATHATPTYTASALLTASAALLTGSVSTDESVSDGISILVIGHITFSGSVTFTTPVYAASSVITVSGVTLAAIGTTDESVSLGTAILTISPLTLSGSATTTAPVITGTAIATTGRALLFGSVTFTAPVFAATAALIAPASTLSASASFGQPVYTALVSLISPRASLSGSVSHVPPVYTASAALTSGHVTLVGSALHTSPTYTGAAALVIGSVTLTGSVTYALSFPATATLTVSAAIFGGIAAGVPPVTPIPGIFLHSPADVLRHLLVGLGVVTDPPVGEWPAYCSDLPDVPDELVATFDTTGQNNGRTSPDRQRQEHKGVQLIVRSLDHYRGHKKALELSVAMSEQVYEDRVEIDDSVYLVHCLSKIGNVLSLGKEPESRRSVFSVNALMSVKAISY